MLSATLCYLKTWNRHFHWYKKIKHNHTSWKQVMNWNLHLASSKSNLNITGAINKRINDGWFDKGYDVWLSRQRSTDCDTQYLTSTCVCWRYCNFKHCASAQFLFCLDLSFPFRSMLRSHSSSCLLLDLHSIQHYWSTQARDVSLFPLAAVLVPLPAGAGVDGLRTTFEWEKCLYREASMSLICNQPGHLH